MTLMKDPVFKQRDYMLPRPSPDGVGFLPVPCPRYIALAKYREMVRMSAGLFGITAETIMKLTLPGLRVFAANEAYVVLT